MGCLGQYEALLHKNWLLKRRNIFSTMFELLLPCVVMMILILIKQLMPPEQFAATDHFRDQSTYSQTERLVWLGGYLQTNNVTLGFYPPQETLPIRSYLLQQGLPQQRMVLFNSTHEIDSYITARSYGTTQYKIHAVIQADDLAGPHYSYQIHMNGTSPTSRYYTVPGTRYQPYSLYDIKYNRVAWTLYDLSGFSLLQDIINTYILEIEGAYTIPSNALTPTGMNSTVHDVLFRLDTQPFPTPIYTQDNFIAVVGQSLGFVLVLIYVWPLTRILSNLVEEKEERMLHAMKMMGLRTTAHIGAWCTTYLGMFIIISFMLCLASFWSLYIYSNMIFIWFFYLLFGMALFSMGYVLSAFFDNAKTASICGAIIYLLSFFVSFAVDDEAIVTSRKLWASLIPTVALSLTGAVISELESGQVGVNHNSFNIIVKNFSYLYGVLMLLVDFVVFMLLGLYLNQVIPSNNGISRPWTFIFHLSYWFPSLRQPRSQSQSHSQFPTADLSSPCNRFVVRLASIFPCFSVCIRHCSAYEYPLLADSENPSSPQSSTTTVESQYQGLDLPSSPDGTNHDNTDRYDDIYTDVTDFSPYNEPHTRVQHFDLDQNTNPTLIRLRNLRKEFPAPTRTGGWCCGLFGGQQEQFVAVKGVTLDLHLGQKFVLLGENGAGKTTLFNMCTGLYAPSGGNAYINGHELTHDLNSIYRQQGVVFQHDVLYPNLTVYEHMYLYTAIKGEQSELYQRSNRKERQAAIIKLLDQVGLGPNGDDKVHAMAGSLSGGQKRKLSLAIALSNDSKLIYLDEFSTGVDTASKQSLWEIVLAQAPTRLFVITTHDMLEAEILGDQIGILAAGKLMCSGNAMFLKELYGVGYTLTINKDVSADTKYKTSSNITNGDDSKHYFSSQDDLDTLPVASGTSSGKYKNESVLNISTKSGQVIADALIEAFPFVTVLSDAAGEIQFRMPFDSSEHFPQLLQFLDESKERLAMTTYGLGVTNLTEVFLKAIAGQTREDDSDDEEEEAIAEQQIDNLNEVDEHNQIETVSNSLAVLQSSQSTASINSYIQDGQSLQPQQQQHGGYETLNTTTENATAATAAAPTNGKISRTRAAHLGHVDESWGQDAQTSFHELSWFQLLSFHVYAMYLKRLNVAQRDARAFTWQLLYPGIILLFGMLCLRYGLPHDFPSRVLSPELYPKHTQLVLGNVASTNPTIQSFYDTLQNVVAPRFHDHLELVIPTNITDNSTLVLNTSTDLQYWLANNTFDRSFDTPRFGGLVVENLFNIPTNTSANIPYPFYQASIHINTTAQDALPVYRNVFHQTLLNMANPEATITVRNSPMPYTARERSFQTSSLAFIICIAFSFIPASFAWFIVKERTDNVKHLQLVSGVTNLSYWLSTFLWDLTTFIFPFILYLILLFIFDINLLVGSWGALALTFLTSWLYIIASCPFVYAISFLFESHTIAQNMTLLLNFLLSVVLLILSVALSFIKQTRDVPFWQNLKFVYRLFPAYCLGEVLAMVVLRENLYPKKTIWDKSISGWSLIFLVLDAVLYGTILIVLENMASNNTLEWIKGGCSNVNASDDELFVDPLEDPAVKDMRLRITRGECDDPNEYPIVLKGLRKLYRSRHTQRPFIAVGNMFFAVRQGECFGFLGANGAGKSTTMKMITSDTYPSPGSGDALLGGLSVLRQPQEVRHLIGYCPQFDAILPLMTGREHLYLYARIKCIPSHKIDGFVSFMLWKLGIVHLADKPAGTYSGGNKRKLSLGIALIGNPRVLILDEVSSGVDPSARHKLWKLISSTMQHRAVILISHFLEECEALSTQIGIMASGRLRAYGTSQQLKDQHSHGFEVQISIINPTYQQIVQDWVTTTFRHKRTRLNECHNTTLIFTIPKKLCSLAHIFATVQAAKSDPSLGITSYTVSDARLDQIFINIMRRDEERRRLMNDRY